MPLKQIDPSTRIGVLYGGLSSERKVSLISGKSCFEALQRLGYSQVSLIDVNEQVAQVLTEQKIEVAYIALHGRYGEDGCIQGLLEIMGIPYTGCKVMASALTMNKDMTKQILKNNGLPVIESVLITERSSSGNSSPSVPDKLQQANIAFPVMVKPINEGSSIGMSKVNDFNTLPDALTTAFQYAQEVMIEQYIFGKSITVGVVEVNGQSQVTPILELRPTQSEWYDLEAKYTEGGTTFILPAELSDVVTKAIQEATLAAYQATHCRGAARVDFVVDADNRFYILEVNTVPGMTPLSDLPAQAKAMGIDFDTLVEHILKTAVPQATPTLVS